MDELAYALITPYSIQKSRTGGIIGRLIAHARLTLRAVRMMVFSDEFVDAYMERVCPAGTEPAVEDAWRRYVDENLRRRKGRLLPRCMLLVFSGPDAVRHLKDDVIGSFTELPVGDTVRGTYGDFIRDGEEGIRYFEPAVITGPDRTTNLEHLELLARFADTDGGVLTGRCKYPPGSNVESCLVMLKPDNFARPSRRPGNIIDVFSRTGLRIVATRLLNMTVAQADEFYGPLKALFRERLKDNVTQEVYGRLRDAFAFPFTMVDAERTADFLTERNAIAEFNRIVEYMTGVNPDEITDPELKKTASRTRCLAMIYEGPDAISKIRATLGSTDPTKAEPATVRSDYGRDLMRNGAHASDSPASADRERKIIGLWEEPVPSDVRTIIESHLRGIGR
ncbi:MAG: nucleoside-diphosphate kinase [Planctomycetota bacterium]